MSIASYRLELRSAGFIKAIMLLWEEKKDTAEIARILGRPESEICRALRIGREQQRAS